ncbi:MAG: hypothetical protein KBC12_01905 [Candidatus Pacebacteria bacterium]|nr:hypothetical protein [Candidatus Paceibacterota bacterium]
MGEIEIHGKKITYDESDGPAVRAAAAYMQNVKKFDKAQANDVFGNAHRDSDSRTAIDFYHDGDNHTVNIFDNGDGSFRIRRSDD